MECFNNIIGLSQTTCDCLKENDYETGFPDGYNLSKSGIFLDRLEGFNITVAKGAKDCGNGGLWQQMAIAVEDAKKDFITDTLRSVNLQFKPRSEIFSGQLGEPNYTMNIDGLNNYAGIEIDPFQIKGGVFKLKRIGVIINAPVNVTVKVYKSINFVGALVDSFTTISPVNANTLTWLDLGLNALELPIWSYSGKVKYYIVYSLDGSYKPKNNKKDCGCGGVKRPYLNWLNFHGTRGSDPTNLSSFNRTNYINGMILDVDLLCNTTEIICSEDRPMDYKNDSQSRDIAYAIRFKAASKVYSSILSNDTISRFKLLNSEYISNKITEWNAEYQNWINWFGQNINIENNNCLVCRENSKVSKGGILL